MCFNDVPGGTTWTSVWFTLPARSQRMKSAEAVHRGAQQGSVSSPSASCGGSLAGGKNGGSGSCPSHAGREAVVASSRPGVAAEADDKINAAQTTVPNNLQGPICRPPRAVRRIWGRAKNNFPISEGDSPIFVERKLGQSPTYSTGAGENSLRLVSAPQSVPSIFHTSWFG